ncbi:MAG: hypothetical protein E2O40_02580 [Planctomycetota bacterium]|nr:MAG: hypothetical protein E2O40_02580 [Planctomycetota bacterium]
MSRALANLVVVLLVVIAPQVAADNLVVNGDFESGNEDFLSEYRYSPGDLSEPGTYDVLANPASAHPQGQSYGDHTSGQGSMLAANGATVPGLPVWQQVVAVASNSSYDFCIWISTWDSSSPVPADLHVVISTEQQSVELQVSAPQVPGVWERVCVSWYSASATSAEITVTDANLSAGSNDFAIDDISLRSPCPDPDGDGDVGIGDFRLVLAQWGQCPPQCVGDIDGDNIVGIIDLLLVLANWGPCP